MTKNGRRSTRSGKYESTSPSIAAGQAGDNLEVNSGVSKREFSPRNSIISGEDKKVHASSISKAAQNGDYKNTPTAPKSTASESNGNGLAENDDVPSERMRHFTRSRNPQSSQKGKRRNDADHNLPPSSASDDESSLGIPIDVCATMLACLDTRSYQRAVFQDANGILEGILQPSSFPWNHPVVPVSRTFAYDIDEMHEILNAQDETYTPSDNGPIGYGRFDVGHLSHGETSDRLVHTHDEEYSAARRSQDVGVIELSSITFPPIPPSDPCTGNARGDSALSYNSQSVAKYHMGCDSLDMDDVGTPGEGFLRYFEQVQRRRKRKLSQARMCTRRQSISVKVASSSSRASIFPKEGSQNERSDSCRPLLLPATLPAEVQSGRPRTAARAKIQAEKLGTYDCRHGLGPSSNSSKNKIQVGRTRQIWTKKSPADQPQRVFFTSLLTGDKLEPGTQKRPRDIRVAIRVGGRLVQYDCTNSSFNRGEPHTAREVVHPYSEKVISQAFKSLRSKHKKKPKRLQCTLDCEIFVKNVLDYAKCSKSQSNKSQFTCQYGSVKFTAPHFMCLPDNNGLIGVVCSVPGNISPVPSLHDFFNDMAKGEKQLCTVCWSGNESGGPVESCYICGLIVHPRCCLASGEMVSITTEVQSHTSESLWKCAMCCKFRARTSRDEEIIGGGKKKRRRMSRLPDRLKDSHLEGVFSKRAEDTKREEDIKREEDSSLTQSDEEIKCALCPYSGGAMSPMDWNGETVWIHEVCRIWRSRATDEQHPKKGLRSGTCSICGSSGTTDTASSESDSQRIPLALFSSGLIKCAATRCHVEFHPMCALVSSKLLEAESEINVTSPVDSSEQSPTKAPGKEPEIGHLKMHDLQLCNQYTLTVTKCTTTCGSIGKDPGETRSSFIPVALCGIHNPKRERSLYGMYPKGLHLDESSMRIPPFNQAKN